MFIRLKGKTGMYNAVVTWFYKDNFDYLKEAVAFVYRREYGENVPVEYDEIKTIKGLKQFIKDEMEDMNNYPFGFKHIDGTYALYQCIG